MRSNKNTVDATRAVLYETRISLIHSLLRVAFLADEAIVITDAILRTLYRMVRHKHLLEWMTAALAEKSSRGRGVLAYIRRMFLPQILAVVFAVLIVKFSPNSFGAALPFLIAWFILPFIGYYTGKNIPHRQRNVPAQAIPYFRGVARDIWRYYETFVTEEEHWLPPDNFQETPQSKIAHRTSPTNIGFFLLSTISAYDLGYISSTELVDRVERTLATLSRLKTFNGHFYNWYDTRTLTPLEPRYVSTVDSGNLAASLIVLKQFALHFPKKSYPRKEILEGIRDTLLRLLSASEKAFPQALVLRKDLSALQKIPSDLTSREKILDNLQQNIMTIAPIPPEESEAEFWWNALQKILKEHRADRTRPYDLAARLKSIAEEAEVLVEEMNFKFLFHKGTGVFSIGFNVSNGQLDNSFYDLLASEARLTSFIAIAKGDVPQSHWFRLARTMTAVGRRILVSWSGSMFEFLMPMLLLKNEANTLLEETTLGAVEVQEAYNKHRNLPWGISEAGYNARDVSMNYQYGPFGVPSLALKRGLDKDLVVAPYATFLGMMVDPAGAFENLRQLEEMGMRGKYGFYESIDFTKDRLPEGAQFAIVQSFMAHHQGMSLVAIDNVIDHDCIQKLFHMDPSVRATELLLQERMPSAVRSVPVQYVSERVEVLSSTEPTVAREFFSYDITPPRTQILSNGNYLVAATTGGSGYSECKGIQVNRWREDVTRDNWGSFIYLKDWETGRLWSAGFQPTLKPPSFYHVTLAEDRVEIEERRVH